MIVSQSTSEPQIPEKSGVIRVKQYTQRLAIQSDGKRGSKGKKGHGLGYLPGLQARRVQDADSRGSETGHGSKRSKREAFHPQELG